VGRTNGIRILCRTSARNTFPIPAMRLWSSKAATPHSVASARSALPVQWPCVPPIWLPRAPASFSAHKGAGPFPPYANQVHPERGLRTQIGGLVQLNLQEV
jgi:hypothetical protein